MQTGLKYVTLNDLALLKYMQMCSESHKKIENKFLLHAPCINNNDHNMNYSTTNRLAIVLSNCFRSLCLFCCIATKDGEIKWCCSKVDSSDRFTKLMIGCCCNQHGFDYCMYAINDDPPQICFAGLVTIIGFIVRLIIVIILAPFVIAAVILLAPFVIPAAIVFFIFLLLIVVAVILFFAYIGCQVICFIIELIEVIGDH